MANLQLFVLGAPRLERGGELVEMDTRKAIALLAYLAMTGAPYTRESLAALFWSDYSPSSARAALRRTLSVLRKGVGEGVLDTDWETIRLLPEASLWVDAQEFLRLAQAGAAASSAADWDALRHAAGLYRDSFLSGFTLRDSPDFNDWQFFQAEDLRRRLAAVLEKLAVRVTGQADYPAALTYARRWLAMDPLNEEAHRRLMLLYAWSGERNAALRQYRECTRILDQELGVSPMEETTQLYQAIVENRVAVHQPAPPAQSIDSHTPPAAPAHGTHVGEFAPRMVGREMEWTFLQRIYNERARDGFFIALIGEAGIGKTRLAEEFLTYAQARGSVIVQSRCYEGEDTLAYAPFIDGLQRALDRADLLAKARSLPAYWLEEAARLVPLLNPAPSSSGSAGFPAEGVGAQSRFFESLRQVFLKICGGDQPGVVFLDDLQWADAASLDLLNYLIRRLPASQEGSYLILATWRGDEVPVGHPLQKMVYETQRSEGGVALLLSRLRPRDIAELVNASQARAGRGFPAGLTERLIEETEGLPFFVVEYLKSLSGEETHALEAGWQIPHSVRDLLHTRLSRASETGSQLLSAAAVIGRSFDFDTLRDASGRSELETVSGLEELLSLGLIEERESGENPGAIRYDFIFDALRTLVYDETSLTRRRLLHRRVADALAIQDHAGRDLHYPMAAQIARHYQASGQDQQAAEYFALAGRRAQQVYANQEALAHYQAALAMGYPHSSQLHEAIGQLLTLHGDYASALNSFQTAAAQVDSPNLARLEHYIGDVYHRRGDWELAVQHYRSALEILDSTGEDAQRAWLAADWSRTEHQRGNPVRALELAEQALELAQASQDDSALAQVHNILGILARGREDWDAAIYHLEQSLSAAQSLGDRGLQVAALNNLALVYGECGDPLRAIGLVESALELCASIGDRHREAALQNHLADLYYSSGQPEPAMDHLTQAVTIFAEIGVEAGSFQPEIWKLTEW